MTSKSRQLCLFHGHGLSSRSPRQCHAAVRTQAAPILALALLLTACATVESTFTGVPATAPTDAPSHSADVTPPADCVNPPPNITTLVDQTDRLACYGNADLTVDAHVTGGVFDCPGALEPAWLGCAGLVALNPLPGTSRQPEFLLVVRSQGGEPLYAVIHPDTGIQRERVLDTLVHVTGHYDDPAAQDCVYTSWPDANPPSPEEVVRTCRSTFVITAMAPLQP